MITWITLRWIEKCCHSEVFWCGIQSKINWSRSRALLSAACIFFEQVLATSNFCSKKKKAQSRQLEAATSGYNLADADSYHVVPRISPSDDSSTFNDSVPCWLCPEDTQNPPAWVGPSARCLWLLNFAPFCSRHRRRVTCAQCRCENRQRCPGQVCHAADAVSWQALTGSMIVEYCWPGM